MVEEISEIPEVCKICDGIEYTKKCLQYGGLETENDKELQLALCPKSGGRR